MKGLLDRETFINAERISETAPDLKMSSALTQSSKFFKVKLYRGLIGLPDDYKEWAKNLGLRKRGQTAYVPVRAETMGSILKLKELLKVELADEIPKNINPVYPKGYEVVGSYLNKLNKH